LSAKKQESEQVVRNRMEKETYRKKQAEPGGAALLVSVSTVSLHFICEAGCAGDCGSVCTVAFYKCDVGNTCFSVSVCASVELWGT